MSNSPYEAQLAKPIKSQAGTSGKAITSFVLGLLSFFCAFVTGILAVIFGILALLDISKSQGRLQGGGFAIAGIVTGAIGCMWTLILIALLLPAVQQVREAARRSTSMNNMKQMALGLHNYESLHQQFPPARDGKGQGLSWRVHILPFMEEQALYDEFHFDEPWDSAHNLTLVDRMPSVFQNPNMPLLGSGQTSYLMPTTPSDAGSGQARAIVVQGQPGVSFGEITDGSANTALILEADEAAAVTWTDPNGDWMYDPNDPMRSLGNVRMGGVLVGLADGSVHFISKQLPPQEFGAMITRDGGETVNLH